ncbi:MAG: HAMP domain-containing histidine kinase [Defluviitaleaceae bacterium]|nr:HAMP domain-containing histidine kinase [Defluviitaleaceae bacterium]
MKKRSFKTILIRNFTGAIFITFLVIYFLFNTLTGNFISEEARRELSRGMIEVENISSDNLLPHWEHARPVRRQLMMNSDSIILNAYNEIIFPNPQHLNHGDITQVMLLASYFVSHRHEFENEAMVRVPDVDRGNVFYLQGIEVAPIGDMPFTFIFYTDITSAMLFVASVNMTLMYLLVISSITSIILSIVVSTQVQNAVLRLCNYAESVGQGKFGEKISNFKYKEFHNLAQSMNNMSNKLDEYENNQKQFFQNVSHELRTPLMSIQGYTEAIAADVIGKDEATKIILAESERMENLVNQLLYISRMDSGLDALKFTTFNLKNMLYDSIGRVKILADKDGKAIIPHFPNEDIEIKADEEKLQRAIDNILTNCTRHGHTRIDISYVIEDGKIKITIADDGKGIKETDLPYIFKRFYKGENGNSGLGLAISKDIVEKLNGSIIAENTETGAKFNIILNDCKV